MRKVIIIPARLESTRLPNKLLLEETGQSLFMYAVETARSTQLYDPSIEIVVVTDSQEIMNKCIDFHVNSIIIREASSGTERVYKAAKALGLTDNDIIVNHQAEYPLLDPVSIWQLISKVLHTKDEHKQMFVHSLCYSSDKLEDLHDPSKVKLIADNNNFAMYFSRACIPYGAKKALIHIGVYLYHMCALKVINHLELMSTVESRIEQLEQLPWIQQNVSISLNVDKNSCPLGVDTREDYDEFLNIMSGEQDI